MYVSEFVRWKSEWRVFVNKGKVGGVRHYEGDPRASPDETVIFDAVANFTDSSDGEATAGYALDFGVLAETGETTLVEWNYVYALGAYGLDDRVYTKVLLTRWREVVQQCMGGNVVEHGEIAKLN